jgi:(E)-4-hydroxy-3-methylbut-2-enyl-diphosphate synthase
MLKRRQSRKIFVGTVPVGGGAPITVQSMTKTLTSDAGATLDEIRRLARAGCDIIRCAVPDEKSARALRTICGESPIPVIADIHFSHKLALVAIESGVHGLRLNPGNLKKPEYVRTIAREAAAAGIPIRVGVNAGSISEEWRKKVKRGACTLPEAMVESAIGHIRMLEKVGFDKIKVALKASDVMTTVEAYRLMAGRCDYPFHVGITEAGTIRTGAIKSSVGIGILLQEGLVDTLRVSLTADPIEEVFTGIKILQTLGLREAGPELVSCPTCGRLQIDLRPLAEMVERALAAERLPIRVAVMGCVVNGPGEAAGADVGIAGGRGVGILFRKGKIVRRVPEAELFTALMKEIERLKKKRRIL